MDRNVVEKLSTYLKKLNSFDVKTLSKGIVYNLENEDIDK